MKNINDKTTDCRSEEVALKGLFLGPQAENREWVSSQIETLLTSWFDWRRRFRPEDGCAISSHDMTTPEYLQRRGHTESILHDLTDRFEKELPKFSPRYIGHMFSETSLPALFGHILTLLHNPNNISGESSKVGTLIEEEAITALGEMMGFSSAVGHFTSGGTIANFEAVYRARARCLSWMSAGLQNGAATAFASAAMGWEQYENLSEEVKVAALQLNPFESNPFEAAVKISQKTGQIFRGPVLLVPEHKHYSWVKAANVFGLGAESLWPVQLDERGRLDIGDLKTKILKAEKEDRPIMMIVSVLGTTELGMIDPINEVQNLLETFKQTQGWHFWHHVDAAYGGFLCSLQGPNVAISQVLSKESLNALEGVKGVNSLTIDPHKLGYVPYSSGAFIAANKNDYYQRSFGAPYVDFSVSRDKGPFTLEGSRSAAGAVATWMTAKCVGLNQDGYGRIIARTIRLRKELEKHLHEDVEHVQLAPGVDSNLLGFCVAQKGDSLRRVNKRTLELYRSFEADPEVEFFLSKTCIHKRNYHRYFENFVASWDGIVDCDEVVLIRICIMNPFFKSVEMNVDFSQLFVHSLKRHLQGIVHRKGGTIYAPTHS